MALQQITEGMTGQESAEIIYGNDAGLNRKIDQSTKMAYLSRDALPTDVDMQNRFNSCVKSIYLDAKPEANIRYVITYLSKLSDRFQIGISSYDLGTGESLPIADTTGLTYPFNEVTPIYNTLAEKKIVGYVYASFEDYIGLVANIGQGYLRLPWLSPQCFDADKQILLMVKPLMDTINKKTVTVWGDSITWGSASSQNDNCYTAILRNRILESGVNGAVINCGVGGENFQNILVRQGGLGFYSADDITLPANTNEKVEIQRVENYVNNRKFKNTYFGDNSYFALLLQGENGRDNPGDEFKTVNPITVNGIECVMSLVGTPQNCVIYLSPKNTRGSTTLIKAGSFLYPNGTRFKQTATVLSIGTNDGFTVSNEGIVDIAASVKQYIEMTDLALEKAGTPFFVICSPYGGTALARMGVSGLIELETALTKRYGNHYFNWRKYLVEEGLQDAGITPTQEDNEAMTQGNVPPSLLSDGLHPNDAGHLVLGNKLYDILKSIGGL